MRILFYICFLTWPVILVAQPDIADKVKTCLENKAYDKARQLINQHLDKKNTDDDLRSTLLYYKGRLYTEEYFEYTNNEQVRDKEYKEQAYLLMEGIAAFQNVVKRQDNTYTEPALRQLGGLHRYLKEIAFSYLHKNDNERFYFNLNWARNCDRFVQQYVAGSANYQMDTMLIYLLAYGAELTDRNFEAKACYETLLLEGYTEERLIEDHYSMLAALDEMGKAIKILDQGLLKYPQSVSLLKYKLHWLMTNGLYEDTIRFIDEKVADLPTPEAARFYFVKGLAWSTRYEEALQLKLSDADFYFKETEKAYQQAVQLSPTTFDFVYNLAALYYNKVVLLQPDSLPSANDLSKDYALLIERATETLENTLDLNAADLKVIDALKDIYTRTQQTDKLKLLKKPQG
jgi:hypothetical protein